MQQSSSKTPLRSDTLTTREANEEAPGSMNFSWQGSGNRPLNYATIAIAQMYIAITGMNHKSLHHLLLV